jgi:hypothetical protein
MKIFKIFLLILMLALIILDWIFLMMALLFEPEVRWQGFLGVGLVSMAIWALSRAMVELK